MPNWCSNRLIVYGSAEDARRFKEQALGHSPWQTENKQSVLNFHSLVPIPPEILAAGYEQSGYEWERTAWGCKWGACSAELIEEWDGHLEYRFETPWAPPIPFLSTLAPMWPALTFFLEYEEMGMGFKGITKVSGDSMEDHCLDL